MTIATALICVAALGQQNPYPLVPPKVVADKPDLAAFNMCVPGGATLAAQAARIQATPAQLVVRTPGGTVKRTLARWGDKQHAFMPGRGSKIARTTQATAGGWRVVSWGEAFKHQGQDWIRIRVVVWRSK